MTSGRAGRTLADMYRPPPTEARLRLAAAALLGSAAINGQAISVSGGEVMTG